MDGYEGQIEYSEVTDWAELFNFSLGTQLKPGMYSYMKDQVGTIYKVYSHGDNTVAETRTYDTYGNLMNQTGTPKTNLGFQSKYLDQESSLYYFYNRYYDPMSGRFITEDPVGFMGNENLFSFVLNNPIESIDPEGFNVITGVLPWVGRALPWISRAIPGIGTAIAIGTLAWELNKLINRIKKDKANKFPKPPDQTKNKETTEPPYQLPPFKCNPNPDACSFICMVAGLGKWYSAFAVPLCILCLQNTRGLVSILDIDNSFLDV